MVMSNFRQAASFCSPPLSRGEDMVMHVGVAWDPFQGDNSALEAVSSVMLDCLPSAS